jgi:tripartite-type tricarboxylate transporter receptor subunit TctC
MSIQPAAGKPGYTPGDFLPVARLVTDPIILATRTDSPFTDLAEVVRRAKADPGGVSYATPGILSHLHVAMERFAQLAGIELNHIPYQGTGPGVVAVLAGQVNLIALPPTPLQDQSAQLRPLAVANEAPLPELPGVPTFRDGGVGPGAARLARPVRAEGHAARVRRGPGAQRVRGLRGRRVRGADQEARLDARAARR